MQSILNGVYYTFLLFAINARMIYVMKHSASTLLLLIIDRLVAPGVSIEYIVHIIVMTSSSPNLSLFYT